MKIKKINISKKLLLTALFHWLLTFGTDRIFFEYSLFSFQDGKSILLSVYSWGIKILFLGILILLYQLFWGGYTALKDKNSVMGKRLRYAGVYFIGMFLLLLMVYPGAWRMDEFGILRDAKTLMPTFWQGYLTSYFYIFSLMLLPTPAGVVAVQCAINSLCIGYVCEKAEKIFKIKKKIWLFLPFLAFPVLDSNMYPMRMSVYVFLELLLLAIFFSAIMEKRNFTKAEWFLVIFLTAICSVWRTEGIYYCIWIPLVYVVTFWKREDKKKKCLFAGLAIALTLVVMFPQTLGNKLVSGDQYEITSMVLPIAPLLTEAEAKQETELINVIDKVLDTKIMLKGYKEGKSGITVFWSEPSLVKNGYTSEEYVEFKSAYYKLIVKYPTVFLKERWETFVNSNGILMDTTSLFESEEVANYVEFRENYKGVFSLSPTLRKIVLSVLEVRNWNDYNDKGRLFVIIWSFLPQFAVLMVIALYYLVRKKWACLMVLLGILFKVPLIFITAPSLLFMYYYGIYLIGNVALIYGGYNLILQKKQTDRK